MKIKLIIRKPSEEFNSIEKVFAAILPFLNVKSIFLPYKSRGTFNKLRNFLFLWKWRKTPLHLSGHDHYILAFPFYKNCILTIHDLEGLHSMKGLKRWLFKKLWLEWPIRNAQIVTTISDFSKAEIEKMIQHTKKTHRIYNPLTLPLKYEAKAFSTERPRILHIGTKKNKNLLRLLEALKGMEVELVVIGPLSDKQKEVINQNKLSVENLYNLSNSELMEQYRKADILSFISTYEGFGLPIIEAQAIGRVVLTSNVSSMPEVAGEGALFVNPFEVKAIKKGLLELIENAALRKKLINKGLENVKRFDAKIIAQQYEELYRTLDNFSVQ